MSTIIRAATRGAARPYLFIAPAILGIFVFKAYPIGVAVVASFFDYEAISGRKSWVGIGNYRELFADSLFWRACWNTFIFNGVVTPLQVCLALALAVLVNRRIRGSRPSGRRSSCLP